VIASRHFDGFAFTRRMKLMVYKRYKQRRLKPNDPDWDKGTWVVEFSLRGHYIKEALPEARNKEQAERAETNMREAIYNRRFNHGSGAVLLSTFIEREFEPHVKENNRSYKDDLQRIKVAQEFFKKFEVRDINPLDVNKFKSMLRKRQTKYKRAMSPATVNRYLYTLSGCLSLAVKAGLIDSNPVEKVDGLKEPPARNRWLSGEEEDRLMPCLEEDGEYLTAFATLPLNIGTRCGELLSRHWFHVNFGDAWIEINEVDSFKTKTEQARRVPLNRIALETLRKLKQDAKDEELIFEPRRVGWRRRQLLYKFAAAVTRAKIDDFHYHDTRRTFATRLRAAGVHEYDIADLLGHSTTENDTRGTSVTRGYAHGVPSRLRVAVDTLCDLKVLEFQRKQA
jgi:integrase